MPGNGFRERHIQVIAVGRAAVVGAQLGEHVAITVGVHDAVDNDVVSGVQGIAGRQSDQADVGHSWPVALAQHGATEVVLADQGEAAAELLAQAGRDGRLPRGAVAAQHDQPGLPISPVPTITAATLPTASDTAWGVSLKPDRHTTRPSVAG
ncbi:hypothetical protein HEP83_08885 [Streptomyces sp. RLA2-12]|nr:hypothetical protein [Streptomyces sp. RLA2-12]